jgi:hypothetical protein
MLIYIYILHSEQIGIVKELIDLQPDAYRSAVKGKEN